MTIQRIKDFLLSITAGASYGGDDKRQIEEDEVGVLKVSAVTKGIFDPTEYKAVKKDVLKKSIVSPTKGDLLFSRANTLELVGATCIVHENYDQLILPDKLWKVETDEEKVSKVYLHYVLKNKDVRKTFLSIATGSSGSMLNISMDKFKNIEVPVPPIELQQRFEQLYYRYIGLRKRLLDSRDYTKRLQHSLSDLAFKGDLKFGASVELEVLLERDYEFFSQQSNTKTIQQLLNRLDKSELNENKFYDPAIYDKAKSFVFELLKEGRIKQVYDSDRKTVKLAIP